MFDYEHAHEHDFFPVMVLISSNLRFMENRIPDLHARCITNQRLVDTYTRLKKEVIPCPNPFINLYQSYPAWFD